MLEISEDLRRDLLEGRVIPFVGAGISMAVLDRNSNQTLFPSWKALLSKSAERLELQRKSKEAEVVRVLLKVDEPDYLDIAQRAKKGLGAYWFEFLREQLDPDRHRADETSLSEARAVWTLGSNLVLTTNFDRVLHWTCPPDLQSDLRIWRIEAPTEFSKFLRGDWNKPTIWHLHGSIDRADEVILDPDSYRKLYPDQKDSDVKYNAALVSLRLLLASRTLLFIGFSLDDQYFRWQLEWMRKIFPNISHFALVHRSEIARLNHLNLPVTPITFDDFGPPLVELLHSLGRISAEAKQTNVTVHKLESIYKDGNQTKLAAIFELVSTLLSEGRDADIILKQLSELQNTDGTDALTSTSVRIAKELEEKLGSRHDQITTLEAERSASLKNARQDISLLSAQHRQFSAAWQLLKDEIMRSLKDSFLNAVEQAKVDVERRLQEEDLTEGKVLQAFQRKKMAEIAVRICEHVVRNHLAEWSKQCSTKINVQLETFWHDMAVEIGGLVKVIQGSSTLFEFDTQIRDEAPIYPFLNTLLLGVLAVGVPIGGAFYAAVAVGGFQSSVKKLTARAVRSQLDDWALPTVSQLEKRVSGNLDHFEKELITQWGSALTTIEAENRHLTLDLEQSQAEVTNVTGAVRQVREIRRILELQNMAR